MKRKMKKKKTIIIAVVAILAILGCAAAAIGIFGSESKNISPGFVRGKLDAGGEYLESDLTLVTEDMFECQGLKVTPDFDATGMYQIFWYNEGGEYLSCESMTDKAFTGDVPDLAKYARIVIYPELEDDVEKISIFSIRKYTKKFVISVDRYQKFEPENLYSTAKLNSTSDVSAVTSVSSTYSFIQNATLYGVDFSTGEILTDFNSSLKTNNLDGYNVVKINCENTSKFILRFGKICEGGVYHAYYYDADGNPIKQAVAIRAVADGSVIITVPEGAVYACFNLYPGDLDEGGKEIPIVINKYLPR